MCTNEAKVSAETEGEEGVFIFMSRNLNKVDGLIQLRLKSYEGNSKMRYIERKKEGDSGPLYLRE